jgi:hypothetical protein
LSAPIALLHMPAHGRCAAIANVGDGLLLVAGQHVPPLCQEVVCVQTEDIGHFQPALIHRRPVGCWQP